MMLTTGYTVYILSVIASCIIVDAKTTLLKNTINAVANNSIFYNEINILNK